MAREKQNHSILRSVVERRTGKQEEQLPPDSVARERWPILWDFLTTTCPDGQHVLEPARISISLGVGCWIISVNHGDLRTKLEAPSNTLVDVFDAWEKQASNPEANWRTWGKGELTLRKKKQEKTS